MDEWAKNGLTKLNAGNYAEWRINAKLLLSYKELAGAITDHDHPRTGQALALIGLGKPGQRATAFVGFLLGGAFVAFVVAFEDFAPFATGPAFVACRAAAFTGRFAAPPPDFDPAPVVRGRGVGSAGIGASYRRDGWPR